jgi:hypothetical protein
MAIARKPGSKPAAAQEEPPAAREETVTRFIQGANGELQYLDTVTRPASRKPAMVRFDAALLARVDKAARRRGISRSAWIQYVLSERLDADDAS